MNFEQHHQLVVDIKLMLYLYCCFAVSQLCLSSGVTNPVLRHYHITIIIVVVIYYCYWCYFSLLS